MFRQVCRAAAGDDTVFSVKAGSSLPDGLQLTDFGVLVGKPTGSGMQQFTVVAKNVAGVAEKQIVLHIRDSFGSVCLQFWAGAF